VECDVVLDDAAVVAEVVEDAEGAGAGAALWVAVVDGVDELVDLACDTAAAWW
jgi:hypothetical protein